MSGSPHADRRDLAHRFGAIASEAGRTIMEIYAAPFAIGTKGDGSPVTLADAAAEAIILARLREVLPGVAVVAEEAVSDGAVPDVASGTFLLVDPLDGTKEFVARNGEFTVNIALVCDGSPVVGVVYAPALGALFLAGGGAETMQVAPGAALPADARPLATRAYPTEGLVAAVSRSHADARTEAFLSTIPVSHRRQAGSSLKFCLIAAATIDVYPRFGPTMEWDIAAGHAVLAAAGGCVLTPEGGALRYGKAAAGLRNGAFVAWGRNALTETRDVRA